MVISSSLQGKCYVMTASLDGESNLKPKLALRETRKYMNVSFLKNISGHVECQNPSPDLFSFSGAATIVKDYGIEKCPIGIENLGMRGTQVRVHMYACTHVHMYTCTHVHMYTCSHIHMYAAPEH